jgi:hypothetical protein
MATKNGLKQYYLTVRGYPTSEPTSTVYDWQTKTRSTEQNLLVINDPFQSVLILDIVANGEHSGKAHWADDRGRLWEMYLDDLTNLLKKASVTAGVTPPLFWKIRKKSSSFGIYLYEE